MYISQIPVCDFLRAYKDIAKKHQYKWIIVLLARSADVDGLYDHLADTWDSLDSLTGKYFLFILAGAEKNDTTVINISASHAVQHPNDLHHMLSNDIAYYRQNINKNQTRAVTELQNYFDVDEAAIPCLIFIDVKNDSYYPLFLDKSSNNIYAFLKTLFDDISPMLRELEKYIECKSRCNKKIDDLKAQLDSIQLKHADWLIIIHDKLMDIAKSSKDNDLLECIKNCEYDRTIHTFACRNLLKKYVKMVKQRTRGRPELFDYQELLLHQSPNLELQRKLISDIEDTEAELSQLDNSYNEICQIISKRIQQYCSNVSPIANNQSKRQIISQHLHDISSEISAINAIVSFFKSLFN